MKDWKTTLAGIALAASQGVGAAMPQYKMYADLASMIAAIMLGYTAGDKKPA